MGGQEQGGDTPVKKTVRPDRSQVHVNFAQVARPKLSQLTGSLTRKWESQQTPCSGNWGRRNGKILVHREILAKQVIRITVSNIISCQGTQNPETDLLHADPL